MNEYDPFDEMKTEGEVPEHKAADRNPDEPAAAESNAHIDSADSYSDPAAGADALIGSAADPVMAADFSGYPDENILLLNSFCRFSQNRTVKNVRPQGSVHTVYSLYGCVVLPHSRFFMISPGRDA